MMKRNSKILKFKLHIVSIQKLAMNSLVTSKPKNKSIQESTSADALPNQTLVAASFPALLILSLIICQLAMSNNKRKSKLIIMISTLLLLILCSISSGNWMLTTNNLTQSALLSTLMSLMIILLHFYTLIQLWKESTLMSKALTM